MKDLYNMIFKRKSIRKFDKKISISNEEINIIKEHFTQIKPLIEDIKAEFKIVSNDETTSKRGECSILFYSENKDNYLLNAGYMMEQVDLLLSEMNIGACWYGMAKAKETKQGDMEFVIMLSVGKCREDDFRKSIKEFKRKDISVILKGDMYTNAVKSAGLAPSACNSQPWRIVTREDDIEVFKKDKMKSFIPGTNLPFYNNIDMGIFLYFLELSLKHEGLDFCRNIFNEREAEDGLIKICDYKVK